MPGGLVNFVFFEFLAEAFVADLKQLRCLGLIAPCLYHSLGNSLFFELPYLTL